MRNVEVHNGVVPAKGYIYSHNIGRHCHATHDCTFEHGLVKAGSMILGQESSSPSS